MQVLPGDRPPQGEQQAVKASPSSLHASTAMARFRAWISPLCTGTDGLWPMKQEIMSVPPANNGQRRLEFRLQRQVPTPLSGTAALDRRLWSWPSVCPAGQRENRNILAMGQTPGKQPRSREQPHRVRRKCQAGGQCECPNWTAVPWATQGCPSPSH